MARRAIEAFESSRQKTELWLKDIGRELKTDDKHRAYASLRAVLHTLRDCLPLEETAKLAGQMPLIVKGLLFDGWKPHRKPDRLTRAEFYARVRERLHGVMVSDGLATRSVLRVLDLRLSPGEVAAVRRVLPAEVRLLWTTVVDQGGPPLPEEGPRIRAVPPPGSGSRGVGGGSVPLWP